MKASIFYEGANGEACRFLGINMSDQRALPNRGGLIVIAKEDDTPVYIACASSIQTHMTVSNLWNIARQTHGATQVYVLPSGNMPWCERAANNLRARYKPALNSGAV